VSNSVFWKNIEKVFEKKVGVNFIVNKIALRHFCPKRSLIPSKLFQKMK